MSSQYKRGLKHTITTTTTMIITGIPIRFSIVHSHGISIVSIYTCSLFSLRSPDSSLDAASEERTVLTVAIDSGIGKKGLPDPPGRGYIPIVFPPKTKNSVRAKLFRDFAPSASTIRRQPQSTTSVINSSHQPPIDLHPCHQIAATPAPELIDVSTRGHRGQYSSCPLVGKNWVSAVLAAKNT